MSEKPLTKSQFIQAVTDDCGLSKSEVTMVWDSVANVVRQQIGSTGPGEVTLPGMLKIVKVEKPAQPAKLGVPNPFKPGETMDVAAKPAKNTVKVRPLKGLKDMI